MHTLHAARRLQSARSDGDAGRADARRRAASALTLSSAILQTKLSVGAADDPFEREADQVADRVVRRLGSSSRSDAGGGSKGGTVRTDRGSEARRVRRVATIGAQGGDVDRDTERSISAHRGGGAPLPGDVRDNMEQAFGADFGAVRVHTGSSASDLSNRIQAKAFTTGSDIFFRDGLPDLKSASGQHLLAHELTHTIQQGGAATRADGEEASRVMRAPAAIQRLAVATLEATPSFTRSPTGDLVPAGDIPAGTTVTIGAGTHPAGATGDDVTHVELSNPAGRWVPKSLAAKPDDSSGSLDDAIEGLDTATEVVGLGGVSGDVGGAKQNLYSSDDLVTDSGAKDRSETAGDVIGGVGSLMTLASSIMKLKNASGKEAGLDRTEAALDLAQSATSATSSTLKIVDRAGGHSAGVQQSTGDANALADVGKGAAALGAFADIFSGIKSTFTMIRQAVDIYKKNKEPGMLSRRSGQEKFKEAMTLVTSIIEAAASGVSAAKNFLDAFGGGAGAAYSTAVPGFGVALGAVELIVRGVDLIKAGMQSSKMRSDKREVKEGWEDYTNTLPAADKGVLRRVYGSDEVFRGQKGKKFAVAVKYKELLKKQEKDASSLTAEEARFIDICDGNEQLQSYLLSKGMQYINTKRRNRAILKISVAMTKISGDVATLGGASAPVGIALKATGACIDAGATVFRKLKQAGRNKAATSAEGSRWRKVFNADKSTAKKEAGYEKHVDRIFDQVVRASQLPTDDARLAAKSRISRVFTAIGVHPDRAWALATSPLKLRNELIEYMKKRE